MLFNSLHFFLFFIAVTALYFLLPHRWRWLLLLLASCYFYMAFIPVYLLILLFTIGVDYVAGIAIHGAQGGRRRFYLWLSIAANVGVLAFFKYYLFVYEQVGFLFTGFARENPLPYLSFILPIGLSFHTFQAMSYTIEVYRGHQLPERHLGIYALYVMYYPQLVAGPIERPQNLLHQFHEPHRFSTAALKAGLWLMAWGLFKKVVVADRLAMMVDYAYAHPQSISGLSFVLASVFYSFQIYCDFSGYSDMAIGASGIMGIKLMTNFNLPYASQSLTEFWRRWHISLSTWFRDYVYVPLGGSAAGSRWRVYANLLVVFLISGLWHGAAWTFVVWGLIHGLGVIAERNLGIAKRKYHGGWRKYASIAICFGLVTLAWVFFRAQSFDVAWQLLGRLQDMQWTAPVTLGLAPGEILFALLLIIVLALRESAVLRFAPVSRWQYAFGLTLLLGASYFFGVFNQQQFIYFQF